MHPFVAVILLIALLINITSINYLLQPFYLILVIVLYCPRFISRIRNATASCFLEFLSLPLILFGLFVSLLPKIFILVAIGLFLNFAVLLANGFQMPVSRKVLNRMGEDTLSFQHRFISAQTRLTCLADIIAIPGVGVGSIGDICLNIGFLFLAFKLLFLHV